MITGAGSRLLPASVPMRWLGTAAVFHVLAWVALGRAAPDLPQWRGGLGWPLAALHLWTVGTLLASAIGASVQLLPVATRQGVRAARLAGALWWLFVPGVSALVLGMGLARPVWLAAGAAAVVVVLLGWGGLLAMNLAGARGMPGVVLHGWGALAGLAMLVGSAASLVALWLGWPWPDPGRDAVRTVHAATGVVGVMGVLVLGLSTILLPMFALAPVPRERVQVATGVFALVSVALLASTGFAPGGSALQIGAGAAAWLLATAALVLHLGMMRRVFATGMRPDLGSTGLLMRAGWAAAVLALVLAFARSALEAAGAGGGLAHERIGRLLVLAAVVGWLGSFLFGTLQRIVPFLAALHAARGRRRAPTPSALTSAAALTWHTRGHLAALPLLAAAAVFDEPGLWGLAALAGGAGAVAFAVFFTIVAWRLHGLVRRPPSGLTRPP